MINELFQLSETLKNVDTTQVEWHRKYKSIPKVNAKAPCLCLLLDASGHFRDMISLSAEEAKNIRKYGTNQGSFPAMNIWPLYCVSEDIIKEIESYQKKPELLVFEKVQSWCTKSQWTGKLSRMLKISLHDTPVEMKKILESRTNEANEELSELSDIIHKADLDSNFEKLHDGLRDLAFSLLKSRKLVAESLTLLFQQDGKPEKKLSIVFDMYNKSDSHLPVVATQRFTENLNHLLVEAEQDKISGVDKSAIDAFQMEFSPTSDPMPSVKVPGFDMTLYTMFSEVKCQDRYDNFIDRKASYPLSFENRNKLKRALEWISKETNKGKTWMTLGKSTILFCYPSQMPDIPVEWATIFGSGSEKDSEEAFSSRAERLLNEIKQLKVDPELSYIMIFVLRKVDKARTKIVQSGRYSFESIKMAVTDWCEGCNNLPDMRMKGLRVIYPLQFPRVLNQVWKQDGTLATTNKSTITVKKLYEGIDFFFSYEKKPDERLMLRDLLIHSEGLIIYGGDLLHKNERMQPSSYEALLKIIPAVGLLLYRLGKRKEKYMKSYPYLLGQLLHISDELHALYCQVVRDDNVPPKLAGSSLYSAAAETPVTALSILGSRMQPYISWAKSYRYKKEKEKSALAGWYLWQYEETMNQIIVSEHNKPRFNDSERAELFIGYLASLPKKDSANKSDSEETE